MADNYAGYSREELIAEIEDAEVEIVALESSVRELERQLDDVMYSDNRDLPEGECCRCGKSGFLNGNGYCSTRCQQGFTTDARVWNHQRQSSQTS